MGCRVSSGRKVSRLHRRIMSSRYGQVGEEILLRSISGMGPAIGCVRMVIAHGFGAEVQTSLATADIGGLAPPGCGPPVPAD